MELPDYMRRAMEAAGQDPEAVVARAAEPFDDASDDEPEREAAVQMRLDDDGLPEPITWEEFFSEYEIEATKRVRRGQQALGPLAREWIAEKVRGSVGDGNRSAKQFVNTPRGRWRISLSVDGDNTTERAAHDRMGVQTLAVEDVPGMLAFFSQHDLPPVESYAALRRYLASRL